MPAPWLRSLRNFRRRRNRRILCLMYHGTLQRAEVPILEALGFEIFIPSGLDRGVAVPRNTERLTIDNHSLCVLEKQHFYEDAWTPTLSKIINSEFDVIMTPVYQVPLLQALTHFEGPVIARVFGRDGQATYAEMFEHYGCDHLIKSNLNRFMFGQAYSNIAANEPAFLRKTSQTIGCSIPKTTWDKRDTWVRRRDDILFLCPRFETVPYYRDRYIEFKAHFGSMAHSIVGGQDRPSKDPTVLGWLSDEELFAQFASSAAFVYTSPEPRHLHYSPVEAMIVGAPVLYLRGTMLSTLAGASLAGECASLQDMREKAERLVSGDTPLQEAVIAGQPRILSWFTDEVIREQWRVALTRLQLKIFRD